MKCWHLTMWERIYETAETRRVRTLSYYAKPNKLVGEGLGFTLAQEDGLTLMGTWAILEALASHGLPETRGWLWRNGSAMDAPRMAALVRIPVAPIERALKHFSTAPMDWLEYKDFEPHPGDGRALSDPAQGAPMAHPGDGRASTTRGKIDKEKTEEGNKEKEERGGFASKEGAHAAQKAQFAAVRSRLERLQAIPEDERTVAQAEDLKKTRRLLQRIQKKQAAGDFTPVKESEP